MRKNIDPLLTKTLQLLGDFVPQTPCQLTPPRFQNVDAPMVPHPIKIYNK